MPRLGGQEAEDGRSTSAGGGGAAMRDEAGTQDSYAEVKPAADPADAGLEWRSEKLKDFIWRARCLGMDQDPEVAAMIAEMRETTMDLDDMAAKQSAPDYVRPWWKDGEYDEERAESANDRGMEAFAAKCWTEAFDEYTEAIRLEPRRAGYHANRAAAALKLDRHRCAADDAARAIERDPKHLRAHLRGAAARLRLREPDAALRLYDAALNIEPGCAAAAKGKEAAARAAGAAAAERAADAEAARAGARAPLPAAHSWPDLNDAAESLLAAEEVLVHNPEAEGVKAAAVEALILCGRLQRALDISEEMLRDSADRAYLRAEALWRGGDLDAALQELDVTRSPKMNTTTTTTTAAAATAAATATATIATIATAKAEATATEEEGKAADADGTPAQPRHTAKKIVELGSRLMKMREMISRGVTEAEDGQLDTAERAFTAALELPDLRPRWCWTGAAGAEARWERGRKGNRGRDPYPNILRAEILRRRAAVRIDRAWGGYEGGWGKDNRGGGGGDAESDLEECLSINPMDVEAFTLLARVKRERGDHEGAFLVLRKAHETVPHDPGLTDLVTEAARSALGVSEEGGDGAGGGGGGPRNRGKVTVIPEFYRLLEVTQDATAQQIRRGYRRAAAKWHPDKWAAEAGDDALGEAEVMFRRVKAAYETLSNAHQRRIYDQDPRRFEERDF